MPGPTIAGHLEAPMTSPYPAREEPCWLPQVAETAPWAGSWASISERCGISRPCVEDQDGYTKTRSLQRSLQVQTLDNGFPRRQNNLIRSVDGPDGCLCVPLYCPDRTRPYLTVPDRT